MIPFSSDKERSNCIIIYFQIILDSIILKDTDFPGEVVVRKLLSGCNPHEYGDRTCHRNVVHKRNFIVY